MPEPLPRVAVLLSTYNGERFLGAQLDSLAAQTDVVCEVFVRDDGSTDATLALLSRYADRWPQLARPLTGANLGPAFSFLACLACAPTDFDHYAFCDQDDVWLPEKLFRSAETLARVPPDEPALYCSQVTCVDESLKPMGEPFADSDGRFEHVLFQNIAYGVTTVMNRAARDLIVSQRPQGGVIMHDWWCALVVAAFGTVVYDPQPSVLYRQHAGNVIGARADRLQEVLRQLRVLWRDPSNYWPIHAQARELQRCFGERLTEPRQRMLGDLVASKATVLRRLWFGLTGEVVRAGRFGWITARVLIMLGLY